jgi:hypothetical protein
MSMLVPVVSAGAQERQVQRHRADEPEGRLLAYYAATMVFSPLGRIAGSAVTRSQWTIGLEGTLLPHLSEAQRRPGIDKPETTNLAPVLPRPRVAWRSRSGTLLEGSWVPPVRVGDATANILSAAASRTVATWRGIAFAPRLSFVAGRVKGAITCNASTARGGGAPLATYYLHVCHDRDSEDWFEPRLVAGDVIASRRFTPLRALAYVGIGGRVDRSRFDIGVLDDRGRRDPDHPILSLHDTRPHLAMGAHWTATRALDVAAEWFHAPGSVSTVRAYVGWRR